MIGSVTALLMGHLASGSLLVTALLSFENKLPPTFLRFCIGFAALNALTATVISEGPLRWAWVSVTGTAALWYLVLKLSNNFHRLEAATIAAISWFTPAILMFYSTDYSYPLVFIGTVSSSLLLGAVTVTMILGHWYLVDTNLLITPLHGGSRWFVIAIVLRCVVVGIVLFYGGFESLLIYQVADLFFSTNALFFLFRILVGLAAPLLLAGLIWQTVKIRSTQSATGLLYVALALVLFGELISHFLFILTGFPL